MLVLARKVGQSIIISDNIELLVIEVRGDQVRLGIDAPKSIPVHRKELLDQIRAENVNQLPHSHCATTKPTAYATPTVPMKCSVLMFAAMMDPPTVYHGRPSPAKK